MKVYDATSIRNVAVVGHGGCGKTQLVSAMLFGAGTVNRLGKVDDGSTVTDFDEEAIARKHTLASSLAHSEWRNTKVNIIDTPGFANFLTDARSALRVVEAAVMVVDAVAGVEVQTEKLWSEAASLNLPRIVAVNRLERDRASLERTLESLRRDCGREIAPIQLPLGEERGFTGVVDLIRMKAVTYAADGSGSSAPEVEDQQREQQKQQVRIEEGDEVHAALRRRQPAVEAEADSAQLASSAAPPIASRIQNSRSEARLDSARSPAATMRSPASAVVCWRRLLSISSRKLTPIS